jgi:ATP-dependent exoDNAse (exonuclease V) alpha subunit
MSKHPDSGPSLFDDPDRCATEHTATVTRERARFGPNSDGTCTVVWSLGDGSAARGRVEEMEQPPSGPVQFLGRWEEHARHGWQFCFDSYVTAPPDPPSDVEGAITYLARYAHGVGPVIARRLVEHFGVAAVATLADTPHVVSAEGLLSEDAAREASQTLRAAVDPLIREAHLQLHALLRGYGFWGRTIQSALIAWQRRAPEIVRRDPFRLLTAGFPGAGFTRCDRLALALGHAPDRPKRRVLAAWHALASLDGDTWAPLPAVVQAVRSRIGGTDDRPARRSLALLCRASQMPWFQLSAGAELRLDMDARRPGAVWVADRRKAVNERTLARCLRALLSQPGRWPPVYRTRPGQAFPPGPFDPLTDHQLDALGGALTRPVVVLTGGPGTGKTFCAAALCRALVEAGCTPAVCAPTGKAAVRISTKLYDAGLNLAATTIHRLLAFTPRGFGHNARNPLPHRYVVVDELSMCDTDLLCALVSACTPGTHLLLVGDPHQLPPVGHGAPLRDMLAASVPAATLTEIKRNEGLIVRACHSIKDAKLPTIPPKLCAFPEDNLVLLSPSPGSAKNEAPTLAYTRTLAYVYDWLDVQTGSAGEHAWDLISDVQVITASNATRLALNTYLQERLNPRPPTPGLSVTGEPLPGFGIPGCTYRVGDKVICLRNGWYDTVVYPPRYTPAIQALVPPGIVVSYRHHGNDPADAEPTYVANGDLGRIVGYQGGRLCVALDCPPRLVWAAASTAQQGQTDDSQEKDGPAMSRGPDRANDRSVYRWALAYAVTCHKYQGSECKVVLVVAERSGRLASREWIYTALSRATELCVAVSTEHTLRSYVTRVTLPHRKTYLKEMLDGWAHDPRPTTVRPRESHVKVVRPEVLLLDYKGPLTQ